MSRVHASGTAATGAEIHACRRRDGVALIRAEPLTMSSSIAEVRVSPAGIARRPGEFSERQYH